MNRIEFISNGLTAFEDTNNNHNYTNMWSIKISKYEYIHNTDAVEQLWFNIILNILKWHLHIYWNHLVESWVMFLSLKFNYVW